MISGFYWLVVLGLFMGVGYFADKLARSESSEQMLYLGLGLFVIAEAIVFLPLLFVASMFGGSGLIPTAGLMTLLLVLGITATVFITRKDFFFPSGGTLRGELRCPWLYYLQHDIWVFFRARFCLGYGSVCCRFCAVYYIIYFASLFP